MTNSVFVLCSEKQNNPALLHQRNSPIRVESTQVPVSTVSRAATSVPQSCFLSGIGLASFFFLRRCGWFVLHSCLVSLVSDLGNVSMWAQIIQKGPAHRERKLGEASNTSNQIRCGEQSLGRRTCRNRQWNAQKQLCRETQQAFSVDGFQVWLCVSLGRSIQTQVKQREETEDKEEDEEVGGCWGAKGGSSAVPSSRGPLWAFYFFNLGLLEQVAVHWKNKWEKKGLMNE